jgi:hypothetical protein
MVIVVSIDVGYHNLGLVQVFINEKYEPNVQFAKRINLTTVRCQPECKIPHTNEVADLVAHFVEAYRDILYSADTILIERQPPGGLNSIETLLVYIFRDKIKLISPNSMHKHFSIGHFDYEARKKKTEEIAGLYLEHLKSYTNQTRKHDMSDAMCLVLYDNAHEKRNYELKKNKMFENNFEKFML